MTATTPKSAYWQGFRTGLPFVLMALPFAALYGVVGIEAGLTLAQVIGFSLLVIAGAAQFAALQLMVQDAAMTLVLLGAVAVNLRMMMYSAALAPHLGAAPVWQRLGMAYVLFDQSYVLSVAKFEEAPDWPVPAKVAYYFGVASPLLPVWLGFTVVGALAGAAIPEAWAIDFIVPVLFLSMVGPMVKSVAHVAAAMVSVGVALALVWLPSGTGLLLAAGCAMLTGALVETWTERRAAA